MKKRLLFLMIIIIANSCSAPKYYQLCKVSTTSDHNKAVAYEDNNCIITYDFWSESGNVRFNVFNKTDSILSIVMDHSFFVRNSGAYDYYQNQSYYRSVGNSSSNQVSYFDGSATSSASSTNAHGSGVKVGSVLKTENSTITTDNPVMMIPSHSSKNISKFHLKTSPFVDCSTKLYPRTKEIKTTNFSVEDTPLIFRNIVEYRSGFKKAVQVDMEFYISSVTNYPQTAFYKQQFKTDQCGKKTSQLEDYTDFVSPSAFYILYHGTTASGNGGLE